MPIVNRVSELHPQITEWRQELHQHPELGFQEVWTSNFIAEKLESFGIEVHRGLGKTGVVGVLKGNKPGTGAIGMRADFDALPIREVNDSPYKSENEGVMHACGHDGHTAMLLGAAAYLAETRNFAGTAVFIFQPAEEGGGGGRVMIEDGLFDKFPVDAVYGMHNMPGIPIGEFAMRPGPIMASADEFSIDVIGQGGHAAMPHTTIDPVPIAAQIILAIQSIVSRETSPIDALVISCTVVNSEGSAFNVIPGKVRIVGTVRSLREEVRDMAHQRIGEISSGIAAAMGAKAVMEERRGYPVTTNHASHIPISQAVAQEIVGEDLVNAEVEPMMGAEDFSYMLNERPGTYVFIGNGAPGEKGSANLHSDTYDFSDEAALYGTSYWIRLVETSLS